jgi:hypothetical protein
MNRRASAVERARAKVATEKAAKKRWAEEARRRKLQDLVESHRVVVAEEEGTMGKNRAAREKMKKNKIVDPRNKAAAEYAMPMRSRNAKAKTKHYRE